MATVQGVTYDMDTWTLTLMSPSPNPCRSTGSLVLHNHYEIEARHGEHGNYDVATCFRWEELD